ncbi:MAG: hypothetical protein R2880_15625 [Deinococcales bacterium]
MARILKAAGQSLEFISALSTEDPNLKVGMDSASSKGYSIHNALDGTII